jgi:hypothetical protein
VMHLPLVSATGQSLPYSTFVPAGNTATHALARKPPQNER